MWRKHIWKKFKEVLLRSKEQNAIPALDGPFLPNKALDEFFIMYKWEERPSDIAIDPNGILYVSCGNRVLKISGELERIRQNVFFKVENASIAGLNIHPDGRLMICVNGLGLALVNMDGVQNWIQEVNGGSLEFPLTAVGGPDGEIYISEGSDRYDSEDWVRDLMEKRESGRLIRYDENSGRSDVLLSNLSYPYGLAITHDNQSILITESWRHRVCRYPIKDIRPDGGRCVLSNLPGYPARIATSSDGGYWMSLFAMRTNIVDLVLEHNRFRKEMIRKISPEHWLAPVLVSGKDILEPLQGGVIKQLGMIKAWAPPRSYGLVLKLDREFDVVKSYHSRSDGRCHGITGVCEHKGELYIVSKGHNLLLKKDNGAS